MIMLMKIKNIKNYIELSILRVTFPHIYEFQIMHDIYKLIINDDKEGLYKYFEENKKDPEVYEIIMDVKKRGYELL